MAGSEARLFTIASWRPFARDLAAGLLARFPEPVSLARTMMIVPSRRSARTLSEAFVALADGRALLLPRMEPAGDLDADEALGSFADPLQAQESLLPAAPAFARRLILARILGNVRQLTATESLTLADQLSAALDTLGIEGRSLSQIDGAVPPEAATHWEHNRQILHQLHASWPEILTSMGWMEGVARRNRLLHLLAERWERQPPEHPVVMAGFSSAPPAVARLAKVVARLPSGMLVVPGLDTNLEPRCRELIEKGLENHPQFGLLRLLKMAQLSPGEAREWPTRSAANASSPVRSELARAIMAPPAWLDEQPAGRCPPLPPEGLGGIHMVEASGTSEEALVIAIAMRQIVGHQGKRAALVTTDRGLARRVQVQLRRFGIDIDDSAGVPLDKTAPGSLFVQLAAAAAEKFAPVPLLGLLLHPLVQAGAGRIGWLNRVRELDRVALRGLRPGAGLDGVSQRLTEVSPELHNWWCDAVVPCLSGLAELPRDASILMARLRQSAEHLAGEQLWAGEAGRALAAIQERLDLYGEDLARLSVDPAEAATFVATVLSAETVRPLWGRHPQLAIWGPLEARLQHADLLILGGMNEGSWPAGTVPDAFLPPAVRRLLDLPGLERRIGYQAHDFAMALGATEVLITRPARQDGTPQVASRYWQRMVAVCDGIPDANGPVIHGAALLEAARLLASPRQPIRMRQPQPAPPALLRPRRISVTEVAMLRADPFSFYARHMLKLRPLEARDADPTGGERGQIVHSILEDWFNDRGQNIEKLIDNKISTLGDRPELRALWRPRVARMIAYAIENYEPAYWQFLRAEAAGEALVHGVRLRGRADRIDRDRSGGGLRIVDYKTGSIPQVKDVESLWETQLSLLAWMAQHGHLTDIAADTVVSLQYLQLGGGYSPGRHREALGANSSAEAVAPHIAEAFADFEMLVNRYLLGDAPFIAKLHMVRGRRWRDYDLLARVAEWLGR